MKNALITAFVGLTLVGTAFATPLRAAGEECKATEECPVAAKMNTLLTQWESAAEQAQSFTPEQREAFGTKVAAVASKCPVGSRLEQGMSAVSDTLGFIVAMEAANAEHCPLESEECAGEEFAAAKELKVARTHVLGSIAKLASYASGEGCSVAKASTCSASAEQCASACCAEQAATCPIKMAARIGEMKAGFATAKHEVANLSAADKNAIMTGFASLSEQSQAVALMPETVMAIAEGFEVLGKIDAEMMAFGMEHPELMAKIPAEMHQVFMMESSLLDESRQLLTAMTGAMKAMGPATETAMR